MLCRFGFSEREMTELLQRMPLGEQLVAAGMLTDVQLELAQREQQRNHGRLAQILVQLGFVAPEALAVFLGRKAGTRAVTLAPLAGSGQRPPAGPVWIQAGLPLRAPPTPAFRFPPPQACRRGKSDARRRSSSGETR